MDNLPNELRFLVASYLDSEPPSIFNFAHEPSVDFTNWHSTPLKSLSQVSWRWRKVVLPILFRYTRVFLDTHPGWVAVNMKLLEHMQSQLTSLSKHELHLYYQMRNKYKDAGSIPIFNDTYDDAPVSEYQIEEEDKVLKSVPNILRFPRLPESFAYLARFIQRYNLEHHIKSVTILTEHRYDISTCCTTEFHLSRAVDEIWSQLFFHINPARVVIAAPPSTLASLLHACIRTQDAWAFEMNMHCIELLQSEPCNPDNISLYENQYGTELIQRRAWTHLSYNEGSSVPVYSTYEYHSKTPTDLIYNILRSLGTTRKDYCNLRSFSFIGVFPLKAQILLIVSALKTLPLPLRELSFQLAPGPESDLLSMPKRLRRAQLPDLWLEWRGGYEVIIRYLCNNGFKIEDGGKFFSKDCGEEMVGKEVDDIVQWAHAVENKREWRKAGKGVWIC